MLLQISFIVPVKYPNFNVEFKLVATFQILQGFSSTSENLCEYCWDLLSDLFITRTENPTAAEMQIKEYTYKIRFNSL